MFGLGTIVNTLSVILAGLLGMFLKKGFKPSVQRILMQANGLAVVFIGISGVLKQMLVVQDGSISTKGEMLLIFSLVIGSIIGEWIDIESKLDTLGGKLKSLAHIKEGDNRFVDGFVTTSLVICVGAMAIVGSMQDGLTGDSSMLITKSILDFVTVTVFATSYGVGCIFSALPIFLYQGGITVLAALCGSIISTQLIGDLSFVGNALIFCVGVNLIREKTFRVGNMLPALLVPVAVEIYRCIVG